MGHALFFHPAHTLFGEAKNRGFIQASAVFAYHGSNPKVDAYDHFNGEIDNASMKGVFGYEYYGNVPARRWIITKLDLLNIQAIGYKIRMTSAFDTLTVVESTLSDGTIGVYYRDSMSVRGGLPHYNWTLDSGVLPDGLTMDSFSGIVTGTPAIAGVFAFTVRVRENDPSRPGITFPATLTITSSTGVGENLSIPTVFELSQNYPNPFNPSTLIRYQLPVASQARLVVTNILGQNEATLVDEQRPAGVHTVVWKPQGLSSGVYLYTLSAGASRATKKLCYIK
jgi:hypothetical protein